MENNLPDGWSICKLGEVVKSKKGKKPTTTITEPKKGFHPYILIDQMEGRPIRYWTNDSKVHLSKKTDVIMVWDGSIGKCALGIEGALGSTFVSMTPSPKVDSSFLLYFIQNVNPFIKETSTGTGLQHVNKDFFKICDFPYPHLSEQQRIVEQLDALMEKVNTSKQRLDKIPLLLKRFRQSVLTSAVTGKLTNKWRKENKLQNWEYKRAEELCYLITKGTTPTGKGLLAKGDIPFLKVYNIVNQKINFDYKPQFVSRQTHEKLLKRSRIYPGDVIMNIVGPPLGKVAIVTNQFPEWNLNQAMAIFRPKEFLIQKFVYLILCEGTPIQGIEMEYRGTAGQSNISLEQCRNFEFPVPSLKEQHEIVRQVERLFAIADKIETRYTQAKAQLDKLPQSILAKAFRGELVGRKMVEE